MKQIAPFKIYDASAGSGKTFTLVKEYLSRILASKKENYYQQLLALTFTNKAVAEMKQRIIENLISFSKPEIIDAPSDMFLQISEELNLEKVEIQKRSKKILKHLLHNYASFSVETIDRFNHRLIRTFARDLKLSSNFEVQLDTAQLLSEAVDQLLSKTGEDPKITKVLLDFALEKTDNDKSWDISKDIVQAAQLIFKENDAAHLAKLKEKSLDDFYKFKNQLEKQKDTLSQNVQSTAGKTLEIISESGLEKMDFSGGYLFTHFLNLFEERFNLNFKTKWQETMGDKPLYTGGTLKNSPNIAAIIDELTPNFIKNYNETKTAVFQILLLDDILKNLTPLFVINLVNQELEIIKEEKNLLPISEFNSLIHSEIKDQPAPFIYERLGDRYRHFFIDEFQDTSLLQWANLKPLIDNALSQLDEVGERGSLMLVGDAKQSIYRWRGGLPEQFMTLNTDFNPFFNSEKNIQNLETNFRSCTEIIDFNNQFFSFIADFFGDGIHQDLYKDGNRQKNNNKNGGYVKFEFIEKQLKAEKDKVYAAQVYKTILDLKSRGFDERDICILTRSKKDGVYIGEYLMEMKVPVISAETLLLQSSQMVQCLVNTLQISSYPENNEAKINLLDFLHSHFSISELQHTFFSKFVNTSAEQFQEILKEYHIDLSFKFLQSKSLYEGCEYLIRQYQLQPKADAYLFSFMDFVFEFENSSHSTKDGFLDTWELKKGNTSIPANEGTNAIQLMTIHKAKGLEFPVVIFPFADIDIYKTKMDTIWYPLEESLGYDFDEVPIQYKSQLADYSELGLALYTQHKNTLELDTINLLYVTLTRAVEELYVFSEMPSEVKDGVPKNYNQLFREFLTKQGKWNDDLAVFEFGAKGKSLRSNSENKREQSIPRYISTPPESHKLKIVTSQATFWETEIQTAIDKGNLLHDIMAKIHIEDDIGFIFNTLKDRAIYTLQELERLENKVRSITSHPDLKPFFNESANVKNERDIITKSGTILRPDRLNFLDSNLVTIIDYKTGLPNYDHEDQINGYANALKEMGKSVSEKILVYTNEDEIVINKV